LIIILNALASQAARWMPAALFLSPLWARYFSSRSITAHAIRAGFLSKSRRIQIVVRPSPSQRAGSPQSRRSPLERVAVFEVEDSRIA